MKIWKQFIIQYMMFVALWRLSLMMFVAYDVCRLMTFVVMMFVDLLGLSVMTFVANYDVFAYRICRSIENSLFSVSFSVLNAGRTEKYTLFK